MDSSECIPATVSVCWYSDPYVLTCAVSCHTASLLVPCSTVHAEGTQVANFLNP